MVVSVPYMRTITLMVVLMLSLNELAMAKSRSLEAIRFWPAEQKTRIVLELNHSFDYTLFELNNPPRLVVDFKNTQWQPNEIPTAFSKTPIRQLRHGRQANQTLRVVMDLVGPIQRTDYVLKPSAHYGPRLVIDVRGKGDLQPAIFSNLSKKSAVKKNTLKTTLKSKTQTPVQPTPIQPTPIQPTLLQHESVRNVIVAIDPGHGGEDPGAIGGNGLQEKKVVLQIAKLLKKEIDRAPGMQAVLTRRGDYFVRLAKRRILARDEYKADIFISIHADAWKQKQARGASVYVLSRRGASSALAGYLAQKENAADSIGGAKVAHQDKMLRNVLADLAMEGSLEHSFRVAEYVLDELSQVTHLHKSSVEQAGFMVLKSLDIPSVLVETGFISNPGEEKKLANRLHQEKLSKALFKAIRVYFNALPPPDTYFALRQNKRWPQQHKIMPGETLSEIARLYQISTVQLKDVNRLESDQIYAGKVLQLPIVN